jgi:L-seryl-tRNA(Ser) seleniumtransferase
VDKLAYAALEATLGAYLRGTAIDDVPVLRMIASRASDLAERARFFTSRFNDLNVNGFTAVVTEGSSVIGGGSAPDVRPATSLIALTHDKYSPDALAGHLRSGTLPVIVRIENDRTVIDLRTVCLSEEHELLEVLANVA